MYVVDVLYVYLSLQFYICVHLLHSHMYIFIFNPDVDLIP